MTTLALELGVGTEARTSLWATDDDSSVYDGVVVYDLYGETPWFTPRMIGSLAREFRHLADWWHSETDAVSTDREKSAHEAYRRVVDELGKPAIPHILRDLRDRGGHWFRALRELTGRGDVDSNAGGSLRRARTAWLRWGEAEGLI